jgi:hypothetical protein
VSSGAAGSDPGTPISSTNTVMLTGSFNLVFSSLIGPYFSQFDRVRAFGNGRCEIAQIT